MLYSIQLLLAGLIENERVSLITLRRDIKLISFFKQVTSKEHHNFGKHHISETIVNVTLDQFLNSVCIEQFLQGGWRTARNNSIENVIK